MVVRIRKVQEGAWTLDDLESLQQSGTSQAPLLHAQTNEDVDFMRSSPLGCFVRGQPCRALDAHCLDGSPCHTGERFAFKGFFFFVD